MPRTFTRSKDPPTARHGSMLSDQTKNTSVTQDRYHKLDARATRYVRLTLTEVDPSHWASLFSFEIHGTKPSHAVAKAGVKKADDASILRGIKAPAGFELSVFASPPDVRYPTCLAAAPTGEVFVGIDENGSLDAKANRGRVVRCVDTDHDGKADKFNVFASMDSPRGLIWDEGTLYVLHPPTLTAYTDLDHDGKADESEDLIKGIGFDLKFRGADHTTNGIRLGIDGYIYVAVGDYGFIKAEGKDGTTHQMLGGGIVRVRTDGTGFEIVSRGPAQYLRRRHRPLDESLHPRQHQRWRRLGRPTEPRRSDRELRIPVPLQAIRRRAPPAPGRLRRRVPLRLALHRRANVAQTVR